jgi:tRNA (uracil-5-)-methyltransferase TRM9
VEEFLKQRQRGTVGIDVGCGNGKYLGVNKEVFIVGSDRSDGLIGCAREFGHEVMVADGLSLPHPEGRFDFAISIAVIHHFSTPERRTQAIRHILSKLKPGGEALIYVWALEQESSRRGYKEGDPQDVLVPWVLQKKKPKKKKGQEEEEESGEKEEDNTKYRYYHLYKQGELEENAQSAGGLIVKHGYERDNWYAVVQRPL